MTNQSINLVLAGGAIAGLVLVILAFGTSAYGQETPKCDVSIILATQNNVGKLTQKDVSEFLLTFGKECKNNVEFLEFGNEVLFLIMDKQTELVLRTMVNEEKSLEMNELLDALSSPINDMINVRQLSTKVKRVRIGNGLKKKILASLKAADERRN